MNKALIICIVIFVVMQFIRPEKVKYSDDKTYEIVVPEDIKDIFVRACYDCHSNKINYPWYSNIAPFSWVVANHTNQGINALNFSSWEKYSKTQKDEKLKAIYRTAHSAMPLPAYTWAHIEADLSKEDRQKIRDWTGVRR